MSKIEQTSDNHEQGNSSLGGLVERSLSSLNLSDIASLDSLVRDLGWKLVDERNGTIKINLNPNSDFEKRVCYVINKWDRDKLSKECPYQIYLHLKSEGFDI